METFIKRHLGPSPQDRDSMLKEIGVSSLDALIKEIIPEDIVSDNLETISNPISEKDLLAEMKLIAHENQVYRSYIGLGYYNAVVPSIIQRHLFENPGWYTQYTPYQSEISQGRLESLINFQTMIIDLTGMEVANASLLDESTAIAEAMMVMKRAVATVPEKKNTRTCLVSCHIFPQTLSLLKARASALGIDLKVSEPKEFFKNDPECGRDCFGMILQYPLENGDLVDYSEILAEAREHQIQVTVAVDIMSLVWLTPPGEWKVEGNPAVDLVVGNTHRFGVPCGYGGPHAAFIASRSEFKRLLPGRIIGVTKDVHGRLAYRMSLQTREQHIRRGKATSNICTAQVLLANMAAMYAVYHGADGLKSIVGIIHLKTVLLANILKKLNYTIVNEYFFDTLTIKASPELVEKIHVLAEKVRINFRKYPETLPGSQDRDKLGLSLDQSVKKNDLFDIVKIFYEAKDQAFTPEEWEKYYQMIAKLESCYDEDGEQNYLKMIDQELEKTLPKHQLGKTGKRTSKFLNHKIFKQIKSETQMLRYLTSLEKKDIALNYSMVPLGSCTMKLNPASTIIPVSWEKFASLHPFAPLSQTQGYQRIFSYLEKTLAAITGMDAVSLQPNSGAQGEYAGLMAIRSYFYSRDEKVKRNIMIIPTSAHGTNPASAVMAGMDVILVSCLKNGDIDYDDLEKKVQKYRDSLAGLMITYPSTHGIYEERVKDICKLIHDAGGQVYMDGANMNAQIGLTSPGTIGADVCHLNLHKTFAIPHGGGGPGVGPIAVKKHLAPFLPGHALVNMGGNEGQVSAAPWGSAGILPISYAYIRLLGKQGLRQASKIAILNANYLKNKLSSYYPSLFEGRNGRVAHEFIIDLRPFEKSCGIKAEDVSKRLIDYGYHAPTLSFPIHGTFMIEPTESEDKEELDRFCEAMVLIRKEIAKVEAGEWPRENNPLVNAPHSQILLNELWNYPYTQKEAFFPTSYTEVNKFWPVVSRIDNVYGDKNFFCSCPSPEIWADIVNTKVQ